MIWCVIWTILMMFWLFGGSYATWPNDKTGAPAFACGMIIPWACVLILGLAYFGAITVGPIR